MKIEVLYFYSETNKVVNVLNDTVTKLEAKYPQIKFTRINTDKPENLKLQNRYGLITPYAFIITKGGKLSEIVHGVFSSNVAQSLITKALA